MSESAGYFAVITADVLFNNKLSDSEKIMIAHISVLQRKDGWCIASNSYFAKVMNCHKNTAGNYINKLKKLGFLEVHLIYTNGSKQVEKRLVRISINQQNIDTPINEMVDTPINRSVEDNNTRSNNTSINIKENIKRKNNLPEKNLEENFSNDDYRLAEFFYQKILQLNPQHKPPNFNKWASTIRLMRERDKKTHKEIQDIFIWANNDHFWQTNILSPVKLRARFDQLIIQQNKGNHHAASQQTESMRKNSEVWDWLNETKTNQNDANSGGSLFEGECQREAT